MLSAGGEEAVVGDLFGPEDAARAVTGCDAVVSAVGSSPLEVLTVDEFVDGVGTRHLVDAARAAGARAFEAVHNPLLRGRAVAIDWEAPD